MGESRKIEFEGGDETGIGNFVVNALQFIKPGKTIHISNAKVYNFHGNKQIQQLKKGSFIQEISKNITISKNFNLNRGNRRNET